MRPAPAPAGTLPVADRVLAVRADLALRSKRAARDFSAFFELVELDSFSKPVRQSWIHRSWIGHVLWSWEHGLHPIVIAPWGHGKTSQFAVALPVFELGRLPPLRISCVSNVEANAKKRVAAARKRIAERPAVRLAFPELQIAPGPPSKFQFSVVGGGGSVDPSFQAWGVFASGIGTRSDLLIFDDVVDQRNALLEPKKREQIIEHVDAVWLSRLEPPCHDCRSTGVVGGLEALRRGEIEACPTCSGTGGGRSVGIGTVWHKADYWHDRMGKPGFCTLLERVNAARTGYDVELYGVPPGLVYPSLEELVTYSTDERLRPGVRQALADAQGARFALEERRRNA